MKGFLRRTREARRQRRWDKERQDAERARMSAGAVELLVELRAMADYDPVLPLALAAHMRKDLWHDPSWLLAAISMTDQAQKLRILGHRVRVGAGWDTDEATIDSTQAHSVRVVHAARQLWVSAEWLSAVDGHHWWGHLSAGRFRPDGTYGPTETDRHGLAPVDAEGLARSVPELLAQLGQRPDPLAKPAGAAE
ncbi:hypothetical protein [Streptacidiphilus sp. EB103A]|uniref:hypothetical protein n=1 Tax=Streptacidiphilus sp. EB103A TaxID=3156275 RepID=UPI003516A9AB